MSRDLFAINGGLYFGYACSHLEGPPPHSAEMQILRYTGERSALTYGPNGSGKSRKLLLPNLLLLTGWSILCIDIKGELAAQTLWHRQAAGSETHLLNPYNALGMPSQGYNPLLSLDKDQDDFVDRAQAQAEAVISIEGNDPHWPASAQEICAAAVLYSRLTHPEGGSFAHVRELLTKPALEFKELVGDMIEAGVIHDCEELVAKAGRFQDISPENRELLSIMSTAITQTRWIDSRPLKRDLARGTLDFRRMRQTPMTVYAVLPANRVGNTYGKWLRLIITDFLQAVLSDSSPSKVPMLLMIDEAAQLGDLPILRDSLPLLRGYGCKVWTVYQDLPQHQSVAGKDRFESAVANTGVLQAFAPQEMTTARYFSERAGQTTANIYNYSAPLAAMRGKPVEGNISLNHAAVPAMLPQEFINMDEGYSAMFTHKTKGLVRAYLPDPSEVESFDRMLRANQELKDKADAKAKRPRR